MMLQQIANDEPHNNSEHHRHPIYVALFFEFSNPALIKLRCVCFSEIELLKMFSTAAGE